MNKSLKTGALLVGAGVAAARTAGGLARSGVTGMAPVLTGVAAGGLSGIGALVLAAELVRPGRVRSA